MQEHASKWAMALLEYAKDGERRKARVSENGPEAKQ